jgi:threonine dehydrogenase-like Zn-dependent dehydrogenase
MAVATSTRAATIEAPRRVRLVDVPLPSHGTLVEIEGCGVCASSLPVWEGRPWFRYPLDPGAPGHEAWGRTADGTRVTFLTLRGFARFAEVDERTIVPLPAELDDLPFPGEALACAVNVVRRARVEPGMRVAVVGVGFLGSAVSQLLPAAEVTLVGRGTRVIGAFERVIECAGTQSALDTASALVAEGGVLTLAGFHQDGPRTVDVQSWNWRGIDIVNAHERDDHVVVERLREAVDLAAAGILDVERLVTHTFPLDRAGDAFEAARRRPPGFVKAVVLT